MKPPRVVTAGLRKKPKNKILFLNTDVALAVTKRALKALLGTGDLNEQERFEAERLIARINARG